MPTPDSSDRHNVVSLPGASGHPQKTPDEEATFEERRVELTLILEMARHAFAVAEGGIQNEEEIDEPAVILDILVKRLHEMRAICSPAIWSELIPVAQSHLLRAYLFQDPFTRRSFEKAPGILRRRRIA